MRLTPGLRVYLDLTHDTCIFGHGLKLPQQQKPRGHSSAPQESSSTRHDEAAGVCLVRADLSPITIAVLRTLGVRARNAILCTEIQHE